LTKMWYMVTPCLETGYGGQVWFLIKTTVVVFCALVC
jgi:hypothetical protein